MAAAGHELLFHSVKNDLISRQDALVCFLHWGMISGGYKCVGIGETVSITPIRMENQNLNIPAYHTIQV